MVQHGMQAPMLRKIVMLSRFVPLSVSLILKYHYCRITHPPGDDDAAVEEDPQVTAVRSVDGNEVCADCSRELPEWVSISLGTTMCSECSGAHRSLGTHISKVQS